MGQLSLVASIVVLAFFSAVFLHDVTGWFRHQPKSASDRADIEQQLKREGLMKADGTISVDKDFDAELNAELKEMNTVDGDTEKELHTLEQE